MKEKGHNATKELGVCKLLHKQFKGNLGLYIMS
jgi:hypothetical protein